MPKPEEEVWLLDAMQELVGRFGAGPWLTQPAVFPDAASFPDAYDESPTGVRTLLRRLAAHAGLDLRLELRAFASEETAVPILFDEVRDGAIEIALFELRPMDAMLGHAVHAIAEAYRAVHRLDERLLGYRDAPEEEEEEQADALASVTAVYLGLGVLAARDAHRYEASGFLEGREVHTAWSHELVGGLPTESLAWLVALQTLLRDEPTAEVKAIEKVLPANAEVAFRRAREELASRLDATREILGLAALPEPKPREVLPLSPDPEGDARAEASWGAEDHEVERHVYRVPLPGPRAAAAIGGFAVALVGEIFLARRYGTSVASLILLVIPAIAVALASIRRPRCSSCRTRLPAKLERCRGCDGIVVGDAPTLRDIPEETPNADVT
ncbi:MAG: hypothetical protein H6721_06505 [Sandaracinus sp.]|nr:hypothetical protein [Sandaracinus sp.]MCB9612752.1 hypothetical protein [Sandaracinus sp.]MCB9631773.1 hypothetical protein [Sandaracinus sp.]